MTEVWSNISLAWVDALRECVDLCQNGYIIVLQSVNRGLWFVKLKHSSNGNVIIIKAYEESFTMIKNGKTIKHERYAFDSLRCSVMVLSDNNKIYSFIKDDCR